jgi:phosphoglycerate dehydrogenase-like enzyme
MARVFNFAPTGDTQRLLEEAGCEVVLGKAGWHTPQGDNEREMMDLARGADALTGTSIRSSPITRNIMLAAPDLRVIAKATVGVDDTQAPARARCPGEGRTLA